MHCLSSIIKQTFDKSLSGLQCDVFLVKSTIETSRPDRFGHHYKLDIPKTLDWLSAEEVTAYFAARIQGEIRHRVVEDIFRHLEPYFGSDRPSNNIWQVSKRRIAHRLELCLPISKLDNFGTHFQLDVPLQQEGWLSPLEIAKKYKSRSIYAGVESHRLRDILYRFIPTTDLHRRHDPVKKIDWSVRIFNIEGLHVHCLHHKETEAFADCYRLFKADHAAETPEWLSAQDLANYLGIIDYQPIEIIFDRLGLVKDDQSSDQKTNFLHDSVKNYAWRIETFNRNGSLLRCLHESQIESFIRKYGFHKPPKKNKIGKSSKSPATFDLSFLI